MKKKEAFFLRKKLNFISDTPWTSVLSLHSSTQIQRQGWYWLTSKIGIVQKYPLLEWAVSISKMQSSFPSRGEVKSKLWKTPFWRFIINDIHLSFNWYFLIQQSNILWKHRWNTIKMLTQKYFHTLLVSRVYPWQNWALSSTDHYCLSLV